MDSPVADSSPTNTTPGTRACHTCSVAKVRCNRTNSAQGARCDRCARLNKQCALQPVSQKRARKKRTTRVAQLEQKLDGLVNMLMTKENTEPNTGASPDVVQMGSQVLSEPHHVLPIPEPRRNKFRDSLENLDDASAEHYFSIWRTKIVPNFPFVAFPLDLNAQKVRTEKPALFRALVLAASWYDMPRQLATGEELLEYFTDRILLRGEKTLDLLQGLMVYMSWFFSTFHMKRRITTLMMMANALATDLGYTRGPQAIERNLVSIDWARSTHNTVPNHGPIGSRTLEERRAYAGMYYLSSSLTIYHRELHSMRPTIYLEECCTVLENTMEYPADEYLVLLVRLQIILDRIGKSFTFQAPDSHMSYYVPVWSFIHSYKKELEQAKTLIRDDLPQRDLLLMHHSNAEIYLYEVGLYGPSLQVKIADTPMQRVEMLWACVHAIKSFFAVTDNLSTETLLFVPVLTWMQTTHAVVNLAKLSLLDAEGWDLPRVRQVCDLATVLDNFCTRFRQVRHKAGMRYEISDEDPDVFARFAGRLASIKEKYLLRIQSGPGGVDSGIAPDTPATTAVEGELGFDALPTFEDEALWLQILGDWDTTNYGVALPAVR